MQREAMENRATGANGRQREVTLKLGITIGTGSAGNGRQCEIGQREATGCNFRGGNYHWDMLGKQRETTGGNGKSSCGRQRETTLDLGIIIGTGSGGNRRQL